MMMVQKVPLTHKGFQNLQDELKKLKDERPHIRNALEEARKLGDFSENAELDAARDRQGFVEGRIKELEDKIARADVIDITKMSGTQIRFGATVTLFDEDSEDILTYQIVGDEEADIKAGLLSISSPLSRALIGKNKGESCEIRTPRGQKYYEIRDVLYA